VKAFVWLALSALGCASAPVARAPAEIPRVVEKPIQRVKANGIELAWDSFGDEQAPPLLLVMGLGLQMVAWDDAFCEALAKRGFRVIRFDNRDVGLSTHFDAAGEVDPLRVWNDLQKKRPVRAPYHIADMAEDAAGLLDALGIPAAHVVGLSLGGMIAQELAIRHPDKVLTLTSIMSSTGDATMKGPSFETLSALVTPFPPQRAAFIDRSVALAKTIGSRPIDEPWVRRVAARSFDRSYDNAGGKRQLVAIWTSPSRKPGLAQLKVHTLVIHGEADPLIPVENGADTAATIPGAKLIRIPGMGHDIPKWAVPQVIDAIAAHAHR
jgi:pimeloyl-ACP methyl ester carboxylesterase